MMSKKLLLLLAGVSAAFGSAVAWHSPVSAECFVMKNCSASTPCIDHCGSTDLGCGHEEVPIAGRSNWDYKDPVEEDGNTSLTFGESGTCKEAYFCVKDTITCPTDSSRKKCKRDPQGEPFTNWTGYYQIAAGGSC